MLPECRDREERRVFRRHTYDATLPPDARVA